MNPSDNTPDTPPDWGADDFLNGVKDDPELGVLV